MAKKKPTKSKSSSKPASERIVMRTGEALVEVEGGPRISPANLKS